VRLETNAKSETCYQGQTHGHEGFLIEPDEAREMIRREPQSAEVLFPYLTADELIGEPDSKPTRFVIDLQPRNVFAAAPHTRIMDHLRATVLPAREKAASEEVARNKGSEGEKSKGNKHHANFLKRWWLLSYPRGALIAKLAQLPRYISCGRVTKRPIFEFISSAIRPNDALMVFSLPDYYSFGIILSSIHFDWFKARCSTLKGDFRYTSDTVFDTFPWPQSPTRGQIAEVAAAAMALRVLRREVMTANGWSLRQLYRTLDEPGDNPLRTAQARLDTAVGTAYGMPAKADPLSFLLELNLACAAKEKAGETITPPGLPLPLDEHAVFITGDCIQPTTIIR
jgi:hypothetical protein